MTLWDLFWMQCQLWLICVGPVFVTLLIIAAVLYWVDRRRERLAKSKKLGDKSDGSG